MALLILAFLAATAVIWISGHALSTSTDDLDNRFNLGEAFGGAVFLAIATNLPEIAITVSASIHHQIGLAVGNILGGIAIQTVVLAILDFIVMRKRTAPLTTASGSLVIVVQACALAGILAIAIAGTFLPHTIVFLRMSVPTLVIALGWIGALHLTKLAHNPGMPWTTDFHTTPQSATLSASPSLARTIALFGIASLATLIAGYVLEVAGERIAQDLHMTGALFGATILAASTALPELTTGLTAVKMGYYELAISDIIGGNAFLPVLFLVAVMITNDPVLPSAAASDVYLGSLGIAVTMIYACGGLFRSTRRIAGMGVDSFLVVTTYAIGIVGLLALPSTH
jgi:cation:H+ antiporter